MEKFNLSEWLKDKSRKVVTRDGRVVKILDTEFESGNGNKSVLAKCIYNNKAAVYVYTTDGKANNIGETENDLFFADEEEGLTEFENKLLAFALMFSANIEEEEKIEYVKECSKTLLDIARKELEATGWRDSMRKYKEAYEQGKRDALKELDSLVEDKIAEKFAELFGKLPMQPYPNQPNPFQPTTVLYGCPSAFPDITYDNDTKTQQDNE